MTTHDELEALPSSPTTTGTGSTLQPININTNASLPPTPPPPPTYLVRFLDLRAIMTSPATAVALVRALERACEAAAYALLDLDAALEGRDLVVRAGGLRLDLYDVAERLHVLAVRAVVVRLLRLVAGGFLLGFARGEVGDVRAGVRVVFTVGVPEGY